MYRDPIVEEKHRVQRELSRRAGGDMRAYSALCAREVKRIAREYGLALHYATDTKGQVDSRALVLAEAPGEYRTVGRAHTASPHAADRRDAQP